MNFKNTTVIRVYFVRSAEKLLMGRLGLKQRKIFFEYATEFLTTKLALSPFKLPLKPGVIACDDGCFEGLFGVFNDSLPDGWGRLLLDRKLINLGINPGQLSPLDRLRYIGNHGMGALSYEPEIADLPVAQLQNLDQIAYQVLQFQTNDDARFVDELLAMNGPSAGVRPKIIIHLDGKEWIIKFRSPLDPKDIGAIEYAYHLMAEAASIEVPPAKIFPAQKGCGYFGVQRFDRVQGDRIHMHTVSGLLHADHRIPSLDYQTILQLTLHLSQDTRAGEKQFRLAVFNVLSHNRDDHSKNFSFLMDETGTWQVSPAYDLTFSSGPAGEHCTLIMGEGKNPTRAHLLKLAEVGGIKKHQALEIIDQVQDAVSRWGTLAKNAGVSVTSLKSIQMNLDQVAKKGFN